MSCLLPAKPAVPPASPPMIFSMSCLRLHEEARLFYEDIIFLKNYAFLIDFEILFQYILSRNLPHPQPEPIAMHYPASRSLSAASSLPRGKRLPVSLTVLPSMILPGIISRILLCSFLRSSLLSCMPGASFQLNAPGHFARTNTPRCNGPAPSCAYPLPVCMTGALRRSVRRAHGVPFALAHPEKEGTWRRSVPVRHARPEMMPSSPSSTASVKKP